MKGRNSISRKLKHDYIDNYRDNIQAHYKVQAENLKLLETKHYRCLWKIRGEVTK